MKNTILFNLVFLFSTITFAQNGINYKAQIKDGVGEIVANQSIAIQFTIQRSNGSGVYRESHSPTTNEDGIIILNIGEGTPLFSSFSSINWQGIEYFLNVQVDTGDGLVNLGTTPFKSVPYAKYAEKAGNVSGLETINEGNGVGWRLINQTSNDHLPIGLNAIDLSLEASPGFSTGAAGEGAIAIGLGTYAAGNYSMAVNNYTFANAMSSTVIGRYNLGGGNPSSWVATDPIFEIGNGTDIDFRSNALTILKNGTIIAPSFDMTEITNNKALITKEYLETNTTNATGLETINEGNGIGWRLINQTSNDHLPIGLNAIDLSLEASPGFSTGAAGEGAIAIGLGTYAAGNYSMAVNNYTFANAMSSTVIGRYNLGGGNPSSWVATDPIFEIGNGTDIDFRSNALTILKNGTIIAPSFDMTEITNNKALITKEYFEFVETKGLEQITEGGNTGFRLVDKNPLQYGNIGNNAVDLSTSIGSDTNHGATGDRSLAVGASTIASGGNSIAMGFESEASGGNAFAMGYRTKAEANSCLAIGSYNIGGGNPLNFTSTNPIFEIGNGTSPNGRSNALTVLQNGTVGIGIHTGMEGKVEIQSNSTATAPQLALIEDNAGFARLKFKNINRNGDDYWDIAGFIGTTTADDRLNFFNSDGGNIMSLTGDGDVFVNGSLVHSSDRRLKRDIETIDYGLAEILQLNPVQYNWQNKEDKTHKSLGVIAQEIQEIIPNVVQTSTDKNQTLSVSYTELIPVLIKAIQEQQKIIDSQQTQISTQDKRFSQLEAQLMNLIEGLENTNTSK